MFASHAHADLFGYYGTVLFPSLILGQFLALADAGALFAPDALPTERHKALLTLAGTGLDGFPTKQRAPFTILHAGRLGLGMSSSFHLWRTEWSREKGWRDAEIDLLTQSTLVCALGSGGGPLSGTMRNGVAPTLVGQAGPYSLPSAMLFGAEMIKTPAAGLNS